MNKQEEIPAWVASHQLVRITDKKQEMRPFVDIALQEKLEALKEGGYDSEEDHLVAGLETAQAITSWDVEAPKVPGRWDWNTGTHKAEPMHRPILDIDFPAALIPSSTPGHFHLYIDKPMPWGTYFNLLDALAEAGLIESGYAKASQVRGYSAVRLPWVSKADAPATKDTREKVSA